jgi:hypothetical protein
VDSSRYCFGEEVGEDAIAGDVQHGKLALPDAVADPMKA